MGSFLGSKSATQSPKGSPLRTVAGPTGLTPYLTKVWSPAPFLHGYNPRAGPYPHRVTNQRSPPGKRQTLSSAVSTPRVPQRRSKLESWGRKLLNAQPPRPPTTRQRRGARPPPTRSPRPGRGQTRKPRRRQRGKQPQASLRHSRQFVS